MHITLVAVAIGQQLKAQRRAVNAADQGLRRHLARLNLSSPLKTLGERTLICGGNAVVGARIPLAEVRVRCAAKAVDAVLQLDRGHGQRRLAGVGHDAVRAGVDADRQLAGDGVDAAIAKRGLVDVHILDRVTLGRRQARCGQIQRQIDASASSTTFITTVLF